MSIKQTFNLFDGSRNDKKYSNSSYRQLEFISSKLDLHGLIGCKLQLKYLERFLTTVRPERV